MSENSENNDLELAQTPINKYANLFDAEATQSYRLPGMFKNWFLDYASYTILDRAVPHINDGLKPVQRRILHAMFRVDDGRFNKVAGIVGDTMKFHPHGDASIGDALVNLGQKNLLIETQGNFGNILTGDAAAAPRYIEARLSKLALDIAFNPKTTVWMLSYDGRNQEPVTLPMKFPLLLAQGAKGIAVGLKTEILPHNFIELIEASIAHLKNEEFQLFPDFPTGGLLDCSNYKDGARGGKVKIRAKIQKTNPRTLTISEIPYGQSTTSLIESIEKANAKGKIKIKKIDDNTAENVEILLHLPNDVSPDQTIDALYAFTDCETSIATFACVIDEQKPEFLTVSEILRRSTEQTKSLLLQELQIRLGELNENWHYSSLEKIFFEQGIWKELNKDTESFEQQLKNILAGFEPFLKFLKRPVTHEDVLKLVEKPVRRISKFDIKKADEHIRALEDEMQKVQNNIEHIVQFTIDYFNNLKKKYGTTRTRKTTITSFDNIEATRVVIQNEKLYINREDGFIGYGLKKDEYICDCSDMDEVLIIYKNGTYVVRKIAEKLSVGHDILHVSIFKRNDTRTIYNIIYRDGKLGPYMAKRCAISGIIRDREYDLTKGEPGSQILYLSANPNGEAELLQVRLKFRSNRSKTIFDYNFATLAVKNRTSQGNILSRHPIAKIMLKEQAVTSNTRPVFFDSDIKKLNFDGIGTKIGDFQTRDQLLIITKDGHYRTASADANLHFEDNLLQILKFDETATFAAVYFDPGQGFSYLKRFAFEPSLQLTSFIGEENQTLWAISGQVGARFKITFGGKSAHRLPEILPADDFISVKSYRAKGKRISNYEVAEVIEIEPQPTTTNALPIAPNEPPSDTPSEETSDNLFN